MSKIQPISTAPSGRFVLVHHKNFGWIEAMFDQDVYDQSFVTHGLKRGGFGWSNPGQDNWMYHCDIDAWAELPTQEVQD